MDKSTETQEKDELDNQARKDYSRFQTGNEVLPWETRTA